MITTPLSGEKQPGGKRIPGCCTCPFFNVLPPPPAQQIAVLERTYPVTDQGIIDFEEGCVHHCIPSGMRLKTGVPRIPSSRETRHLDVDSLLAYLVMFSRHVLRVLCKGTSLHSFAPSATNHTSPWEALFRTSDEVLFAFDVRVSLVCRSTAVYTPARTGTIFGERKNTSSG